jgi:hypothetical protein
MHSQHTSLLEVILAAATNASAEPRLAEELEQLRINTAYIIEKGELEMDVVPSYFDHEGAQHRSVEAELEYAVSERLMFEVEVPYHWRSFDDADRDIDGTGNVEVGAKWLLTQGGSFAAAFNVGVELPAGSERREIANDTWGVELSVPLSFRFLASQMSLHIEPGVEWEEHEGFEEQTLNIALEHRPGDSILTLQLGSNITREEGDVEAYIAPAFELAAVGSPFQFGMALPVGITSESANWGVLIDLEVEF